MRYRPLGKTGLSVSELSFGAARGAIETPDAFLATINAAMGAGINYIDTAHKYGQGECERLLGQALKGHDDVIVQTKYLPYESFAPEAAYTGNPSQLIEAAEQSCKRLGRDHIDVYLGHGIRSLESCDRFMNDGCLDAMLKLKAQGKVRHIGISELSEADGTHQVLRKVLAANVFDVVMLTVNIFLQTAIDDILPLCNAAGVGTAVMMPLNQASKQAGLVSVETAKESVRRYIAEKQLPDAPPYTNQDLFDFLEPYTMAEAAIRFVLSQSISSCCVGASRPERIVQNVKAATVLTEGGAYLTASQLHRLRELFGGITLQVR